MMSSPLCAPQMTSEDCLNFSEKLLPLHSFGNPQSTLSVREKKANGSESISVRNRWKGRLLYSESSMKQSEASSGSTTY